MTNLINNTKLTNTVYYSGILFIKQGNSCVDGSGGGGKMTRMPS